MEDKITRYELLRKAAAGALYLTGAAALIRKMPQPAHAAGSTCQDCDYSIRIIEDRTGYLICFQIASKKQLALKDGPDYLKASVYKTERSCPAKARFGLAGYVKRTDAPFPPVFSGLSPYGALGRRITPGIRHPANRVYTCVNCGFAAFYIYTSGPNAKLLVCGKCSTVMKV